MKKQIDWEKVASSSGAEEENLKTSNLANREENLKKENTAASDGLISENNGIIENPVSQNSQKIDKGYIDLGDMGESINIDKTSQASNPRKKGFEDKDNVMLGKKAYRKKYNPTYEKFKFRPLNFVVTMLAIVALAVVAVGVVGFIIKEAQSIFSVGVKSFFNETAVGLTLGLSGVFGVIIYIILGILVLLVAALAFPLFINGVKIITRGFKVNSISDADYYKNIFVKQIIRYSIFNIVISAIYVVLSFMFKFKLFAYICIVGACVYALVTALAITSYYVNITRFKKAATAEELSTAEQNAKEAVDYVKMHNIHYGKRRGRLFR